MKEPPHKVVQSKRNGKKYLACQSTGYYFVLRKENREYITSPETDYEVLDIMWIEEEKALGVNLDFDEGE